MDSCADNVTGLKVSAEVVACPRIYAGVGVGERSGSNEAVL